MVVFGDYDDPDQTLVNYGFSKDKRFDLRQIKTGLCVNSDGFPIYGELVNGNEDDKTWSNELLKKFKDVVNSEFASRFVADSQLITVDNLKLMYEKGILFISRLPDTFRLSDELKERAWCENHWQEAGQIAQTTGSATYQFQEFPGEIEGITYRFVVVNSSSLVLIIRQTEKKKPGPEIEKGEQALAKAIAELAKTDYACRPDADGALRNWLAKQKSKYHQIDIIITEESVTQKRGHRGRPRSDEAQPPVQTVYRLVAKIIGRNESAIQNIYNLARTFILITSAPEIPALKSPGLLGIFTISGCEM